MMGWFFGVVTLAFVVPCLLALAWWSQLDRPRMWNTADWSSASILPAAADVPGAAIHVLAARTGGLKGAVAVHSWLVFKAPGETRWTRWDVVGWGTALRRDGWAADARWYGNEPWFVASVTGQRAAALLPAVRAAVRDYPHGGRGDYVLWPGPNSNSFVAHVLRSVPGLDAQLPPHAVGKDWMGRGLRAAVDVGGDFHLSAWGLAGLAAGPRTGVELQLLGQTFGIDVRRPALKLPGIGRVGVPEVAGHAARAEPAPGG
jgi:hypothetical protein